MSEIDQLTGIVADLAEHIAKLATAVEVQHQQWTEQAELNKVILNRLRDHDRSIYGFDTFEGILGESKTQAVRIAELVAAEKLHSERFRAIAWMLIGLAASITAIVIGAGAVAWLGWG